MLIKVDEDLPGVLARLLCSHGHDAATVIEQGMSGWEDADVWAAIQAERRFLVTADKGFADIRLYPPGTHAGILLLRPNEDGIRPLVVLLESVLAIHNLADLAEMITVASPQGIRVRRRTTS